MSKKQLSKNKPRPYAPEFRRQMVELVRAGRTPEQLAKEFEPSAQAFESRLSPTCSSTTKPLLLGRPQH